MGCVFVIIWLAIIVSCVSLLSTILAIVVTITWNGLLLPNGIVDETLAVDHAFTVCVVVVSVFMVLKIIYDNIRKRI